MTLWSEFEIVLEIAIARLAEMKPLAASIVLGGLSFGNKPSILYSLLVEAGEQSKIEPVKALINHARRNALVHGTPATEDDYSNFAFIKRDIKDRYRVSRAEFTAAQFHEHFLEFRRLHLAAADALNISGDDIEDYAKAGRFGQQGT